MIFPLHIADKGLVAIVYDDCLKLKRKRERKKQLNKKKQAKVFLGWGVRKDEYAEHGEFLGQ